MCMVSPFVAETVVDDKCVDFVPFAHTSQARASELGAIGNDDRAIGGSHHAPFGFDEEHVAVEEAFGVHTCHAEECFLDVDRLEHVIRIGSVRDTGAMVDGPAEEDQVDGILGREEVRDGEGVGHDLERAADQLSGEFVSGASAVEEEGVVIVDEGRGGDCDPSFLVPRFVVPSAAALELANGGAGAGKEDPAVGPFGFPSFFKGFQIATDGRFADIHGRSQVRNGNEAMLANQFAQFGTSRRGALEMTGGNHPEFEKFRSVWEERHQPVVQNCHHYDGLRSSVRLNIPHKWQISTSFPPCSVIF